VGGGGGWVEGGGLVVCWLWGGWWGGKRGEGTAPSMPDMFCERRGKEGEENQGSKKKQKDEEGSEIWQTNTSVGRGKKQQTSYQRKKKRDGRNRKQHNRKEELEGSTSKGSGKGGRLRRGTKRKGGGKREPAQEKGREKVKLGRGKVRVPRRRETGLSLQGR